MKKLILLTSLLLLSVALIAQQDKAKLQSKVAKSDAEISDPKKADQPKTWLNRAELFLEVYNAPTKDLVSNMGHKEIKLLLAKEKVLSTRSVDIFNETYDVEVYADKELYYNPSGQLLFWVVTDYAVEKPLLKVLEAYLKAAALDTKGANTKKIKESLLSLQLKLTTDGYIAYVTQDYPLATEYYEAAITCSSHELVAAPDTSAIYMVGYLALNTENPDKAVVYYKKAMDAGYTAGGDIYADYARALKAKKDTTAAVEILTTGFSLFPTNKEIIFALINTYIERGEDPKKILPFVRKAEESDPTNASVSYVEGMIYEQLNDFANAEKAYKKSIEKDEGYFPAYYNLGVLYYNEGANINNKAIDELDQKKYEALMERSREVFKTAIPFLEKAYEINATERSTVDLLKTLYFRLREESTEMENKYEHYKKLLDSM